MLVLAASMRDLKYVYHSWKKRIVILVYHTPPTLVVTYNVALLFCFMLFNGVLGAGGW